MSKRRGKDTKWDTYTSYTLQNYNTTLFTCVSAQFYAHLSERYHKQAHTSSIKLKYSEV